MNHFMNNGKEYLRKDSKRQYRSNQGRSPKQMRSSYIGAAISGLGLLFILIYILMDKYLF